MLLMLKRLRLDVRLGVTEQERSAKQPVYVTVSINFRDPEASHTDRLEDTVDYRKVRDALVAVVSSSEFRLVERLSHILGQTALQSDRRVQRVRIAVHKPAALRGCNEVVCLATVTHRSQEFARTQRLGDREVANGDRKGT
jgi:dihydroneopterin aldolase